MLKSLQSIANVISWNIWQMDGLKCTIPESCTTKTEEISTLFGDIEKKMIPCEGCTRNDIHKHNGVYPLIRDWKKKDQTDATMKFSDILKL
jgi:hypothetical protein